jgi:hypothetical protein
VANFNPLGVAIYDGQALGRWSLRGMLEPGSWDRFAHLLYSVLAQPGVLGFGLLVDRNIGVGVFP